MYIVKAEKNTRCLARPASRKAFDTELFNLWTFDADGKVVKLREFCDTAKLASEVAAVGVG